MSQLSLPIPEIAPDVQLAASRKLARMVSAKRRSFECEQYRRRRIAALKGLAR